MRSTYFKLITTFLSFTFFSILNAMEERPHLESKIIYRSSLYNPLPNNLKRRPLVYYKTLTVQKDKFSCGHRTLFHALSIERAAKKAQAGIPLEKSLSWLLKDQKSFSDVYRKITGYINAKDPETDHAQGLYDYHLFEASHKKLPLLKGKMIPIYLEKDGQINIIHNPKPSTNTQLFPDEYFDSHDDLTRVELKKSKEFTFQLNKLKEPFDTTHFACLLHDRHWILASIMLNTYKKAKLVILDSANHDLMQNDAIVTMIETLLEFVEEFNQK